MTRIVHVLRCKKNGSYILRPVGTFRGYGAYVSINPLREIEPDSALNLGQTIAELLELSRPTGFHLRDIKEYDRQTRDAESQRIYETYYPPPGKGSTSQMARQFDHAEIEQKYRQKSWVVVTRIYDTKLRSLTTDQEFRVRHRDGIEVLGQTVIEALENR